MNQTFAQAVHRAPRVAMALGVTGAAMVAIGCAKPLFPENAPRTQFEKFDSMRSGAAPAEEPDIFGRPQPALRARLTPKSGQ
jgi:hypothetical protein